MTGEQTREESPPWRIGVAPLQRRGSRLWAWPVVIVAAAVVASVVLPVVDALMPDSLKSLAIPRDPGVTASRLSAVASGMISFTGFVFTIVMLTVQFGTSSLSARLIPFFQRDRVVRLALGIFPATFVYSVLISIEIGADKNREFPSISVGFATGLMLASVVVFLILVQRIADMMRPPRLFRQVAAAAAGAILTSHTPRRTEPDAAMRVFEAPPDGYIHNSGYSGTLTGVDVNRLVRLASRRGIGLVLIPRIGDFIFPGAPLFEVYRGARTTPLHALGACLHLGEERRLRRDPAFGLLVLSDVGVKALSAAINDPTTATQAMDHIEDLLLLLARRELGPRVLRDRRGTPRLGVHHHSWTEYLSIGTDEIRHCALDSPQAASRLHVLLEHLEQSVDPSRRAAVRERLRVLDDAVEAGHDRTDRDRIEAADIRFVSPFRSA